MADKDKKIAMDEITPMEEDFAKWYTDIVKKTDLVDYSGVKGCMIIRPYGYAIWENIQKNLDNMFKENKGNNAFGIQNSDSTNWLNGNFLNLS